MLDWAVPVLLIALVCLLAAAAITRDPRGRPRAGLVIAAAARKKPTFCEKPPALSLAVDPRAAGVLTLAPVNGTSDQFTVQATAPNTTTYPTSVVATARDANGGLATSTTIVDVTSDLYVAYANGGAAAVARYDAHGNARALPSGAFAGLTNPVALAYDAVDRTIFVADSGSGQVLAFDENGTPVAGFAPRAVAGGYRVRRGVVQRSAQPHRRRQRLRHAEAGELLRRRGCARRGCASIGSARGRVRRPRRRQRLALDAGAALRHQREQRYRARCLRNAASDDHG